MMDQARTSRVANFISMVGSPFGLSIFFLAAIYLGIPQARTIALISAFWMFVVPLALLFWGIRRGWWQDLDLSDRQERYGFLPAVLASTLIALGLAWALAPNAILLPVLSMMAAWIFVDWIVTFWWKISMHAGAAASLVTFVAIWRGHLSLLFLWLIPLVVGWSRAYLKRHTWSQVTAGWVQGLIFGTVFGVWARQHGFY